MQPKHSFFSKALHSLHFGLSQQNLNLGALLYRVEFMRIDSPKCFENYNLGLSFKYPQQYEYLTRSNGFTTMIDLMDRNSNGQKEMLRITYDVLKHDITPKDYMHQWLSFVSQNGSHDYRVVEEYQVDVNGAQSTQMLIEWNTKGMSFTNSIRHPYQENTIVVINLWIEDVNMFDIKKEIVKNILHSLILSRPKTFYNYTYLNETFGFSLTLPPSSEFTISSKFNGQSAHFSGRNVIAHLKHMNLDEIADHEIVVICEDEQQKRALPSMSVKVGTSQVEGEIVKFISSDFITKGTNQKTKYCFFEVYFVHNSKYYTISARCFPSETVKFETQFTKILSEMKLFETRPQNKSSILYENSNSNLQLSIPIKSESSIKEYNTTHSCVDIVTPIDKKRFISTSIYTLDNFASTMDQLSKRLFTESACLPAFTLIRNERRKLKDGRTDCHHLVCTFYDKTQCKFLTSYQTSTISKKGNVIVIRISVEKGSFNPEIETMLESIQSSIKVLQ